MTVWKVAARYSGALTVKAAHSSSVLSLRDDQSNEPEEYIQYVYFQILYYQARAVSTSNIGGWNIVDSSNEVMR